MLNIDKELIGEIIRKESDKHDLVYIGIINNSEQVIVSVSKSIIDFSDFMQFKESVLDLLYTEIHYPDFVEKIKKGESASEKFNSSVRHYLSNILKKRKEQNPDISPDKELMIQKTVAFLLSRMLFREIYSDFKDVTDVFPTPGELKQFFVGLIDQKYPLGFDHFVARLESDDPDFWERVGDMLINISQHVTKSHILSYTDREIIRGEIVNEAYLVIKNEISQRRKVFKDASHFYKHSYLVCRNKCFEYNRAKHKEKLKMDSLEDIYEPLADYTDHEPIDPAGKDLLYDVNTDNAYEMANLLAIILYNPDHRLYGPLTAGEEEQVELLMDIAVHDLSYDQVIEKNYEGFDLSPEERKKMNAKLRQDYVRIKKKLIRRLEQILKKDE